MPSYNFAISNRIMYEENIQYSTRKEQEESTWNNDVYPKHVQCYAFLKQVRVLFFSQFYLQDEFNLVNTS